MQTGGWARTGFQGGGGGSSEAPPEPRWNPPHNGRRAACLQRAKFTAQTQALVRRVEHHVIAQLLSSPGADEFIQVS